MNHYFMIIMDMYVTKHEICTDAHVHINFHKLPHWCASSQQYFAFELQCSRSSSSLQTKWRFKMTCETCHTNSSTSTIAAMTCTGTQTMVRQGERRRGDEGGREMMDGGRKEREKYVHRKLVCLILRRRP